MAFEIGATNYVSMSVSQQRMSSTTGKNGRLAPTAQPTVKPQGYANPMRGVPQYPPRGQPYPQFQPPSPQYMPTQQFQQPMYEEPRPKAMLTMNDANEAIGMVTLRLSRVEKRLELIEEQLESQPQDVMQNDGMLISKEVFDSMMGKIAALEQRVYSTAPIVAAAAPSQDVNKLRGDVDEIRKNLMNLQNYTMDVNQRLVDMVVPVQEVVTNTYNRDEFDLPAKKLGGDDCIVLF